MSTKPPLELVKIRIRKFRSIEELHIKNIGRINIFVGPNDSGKTNVLEALAWFNTDGELEDTDKPYEESIDGEEDIITLYFKIINKNRLMTIGDFFINKNKLKDTIYLSISKKANGKFSVEFIDKNYNSEELISEKLIIKKVAEIIKSKFSKSIHEYIKEKYPNLNPYDVLQHQNFSMIPKYIEEFVNTVIEAVTFIEELDIGIDNLSEQISEIIEENISQLSASLSATNFSFQNISFSPASLTINFLREIKESILEEISDLSSDYNKLIQNLMPEIVYLKEDYELDDKIEKSPEEKWSDIINDENYPITWRLFKSFNLDLGPVQITFTHLKWL